MVIESERKAIQDIVFFGESCSSAQGFLTRLHLPLSYIVVATSVLYVLARVSQSSNIS